MPKGTKVVFEATTKDFESCYPEKNQKRKISIPYEPFSKTPNFVHFTMFFNFICIDLYIYIYIYIYIYFVILFKKKSLLKINTFFIKQI